MGSLDSSRWQAAGNCLPNSLEITFMRAEFLSERLHQLIERQHGLRAVLRGAHMPSHAVSEAARMLRATAHEIEVLADDCDQQQARAAASGRTSLSE